MNRDEILRQLSGMKETLENKYKVKSLALFGSHVRGETHPDSDLDLLVEFKEAVSFDNYMDLKFLLEDHFHKKVDLVMKNALKPWYQPLIEKEAIAV
jgi:hypothetical protein